MRVVSGNIGRAFAAVVFAAARAAMAQQIPPSIEFRVPKPPTVAVSDSGAILVYEPHVTSPSTSSDGAGSTTARRRQSSAVVAPPSR